MRWVRLLLVLGQIASLASPQLCPSAALNPTSFRWASRRIGKDFYGWPPPKASCASMACTTRWCARRGHRPAGGTDIEVTPDGSVWMATGDGLVRYDHGSFTKELAGQLIRALTVTRAGRLLASTTKDLYIALEPDRKPVRWSTPRALSVNGRFQPDLEGKTWFGCGLYLCSWSDADVQAVAAGARLEHPTASASPINRADSPDTPGQLGRHRGHARPPHLGPQRSGCSRVRRRADREPHAARRNISRCASGFLSRPSWPSVDTWAAAPRRGERRSRNYSVPRGAPLQDVTAVFEDRRGTLWFGLAGKGLAALPDESRSAVVG